MLDAELNMLPLCVGVWLPWNLARTLLDLKKTQLCTLRYSRIIYNNMADARICGVEGTLVRFTVWNWGDDKTFAEDAFLHAEITSIIISFFLNDDN
jgi:hypothetical protein